MLIIDLLIKKIKIHHKDYKSKIRNAS